MLNTEVIGNVNKRFLEDRFESWCKANNLDIAAAPAPGETTTSSTPTSSITFTDVAAPAIHLIGIVAGSFSSADAVVSTTTTTTAQNPPPSDKMDTSVAQGPLEKKATGEVITTSNPQNPLDKMDTSASQPVQSTPG